MTAQNMNAQNTKANDLVFAALGGLGEIGMNMALYGVMAGIVLNKLFFPADDPTTSLLLTYATFAVGFLTRPIGGIVFGLSAALYGDAGYEAGRIKRQNFSDYRLLTLAQMPVIDVQIIDSDAPPGGIGEPGVPPIAPAVANALARLTGKRQRRLPLVV